jgi:hypothetical protein
LSATTIEWTRRIGLALAVLQVISCQEGRAMSKDKRERPKVSNAAMSDDVKALIQAEERNRNAWDAARRIWKYLDTCAGGGFPRNWHLELKVWDKELRGKISRDSFRSVADKLRSGLSPVKGLLYPSEEAALRRCSY